MYPATRHVKHWLRRTAFQVCRAGLRAAAAVPLPTVFILGHMRSGSTLLLHLLLTHPEIIGCGERNACYRTQEDLDRLAVTARRGVRAWFKPFRYVVDQINHDRFTPWPELLGHPQLRLIFLIREPPLALASIVNLARDFYRGGSTAQATDYYVQRLNTLGRYAATCPHPDRATAVTYEDLVDRSQLTLERLQGFLDLETGFTEQYDLQPFTGRRGDPADKIRAGHIVRGPGPEPLEMPSVELDRAWQAYHACRQAMERLAQP